MNQCAAKQDVDAMDENDFVDISVNYQSEKTWTAGSKAAEKQKLVTKKRKVAHFYFILFQKCDQIHHFVD